MEPSGDSADPMCRDGKRKKIYRLDEVENHRAPFKTCI
jgi:hypothetical protein